MLRLVALLALVLALAACSSDGRAALVRLAAARDAGASPERVADRVEAVAGVADQGRDPGVVGIALGGSGLCTGVLVSPRLVLTARHCVSHTLAKIPCPPNAPQVLRDRPAGDLQIMLGEDTATARRVAGGAAIIAPTGSALCDADLAVIVLDEAITTVKPLPLAAAGPAVGDRVRAVGFALPTAEDPTGTKRVREHVGVVAVTGAEFVVEEASCRGGSGGPALDEQTGAVIGVVSRASEACDGPGAHHVYTRVDVFAALTELAFGRATQISGEETGLPEASFKPVPRGAQQKPPSDVGRPCDAGAACATGTCITADLEGPSDYCSRPCASGDRCPVHFHCEPVELSGTAADAGGSAAACVRTE